MTPAEKYELISRIILTGVLLLYAVIVYRQYQKNKAALSAHQKAILVSPPKNKFLLSWFIYFLAFFIPVQVLLWSIKSLAEVFWVCLFMLPIQWLITSIPAYPYYSLLVYDNKLEGAPMWGLFWQRAEIDFNDIDMKRTVRKNLFQKLGIVFFYSTNGEKVMTFGLDDSQISQVLTMKTNDNVQ